MSDCKHPIIHGLCRDCRRLWAFGPTVEVERPETVAALTEALAALNLAFALLDRMNGDPLPGCERGPAILRHEGAERIIDAVRNAAIKARSAFGMQEPSK